MFLYLILWHSRFQCSSQHLKQVSTFEATISIWLIVWQFEYINLLLLPIALQVDLHTSPWQLKSPNISKSRWWRYRVNVCFSYKRLPTIPEEARWPAGAFNFSVVLYPGDKFAQLARNGIFNQETCHRIGRP